MSSWKQQSLLCHGHGFLITDNGNINKSLFMDWWPSPNTRQTGCLSTHFSSGWSKRQSLRAPATSWGHTLPPRLRRCLKLKCSHRTRHTFQPWIGSMLPNVANCCQHCGYGLKLGHPEIPAILGGSPWYPGYDPVQNPEPTQEIHAADAKPNLLR